MGLKIFLKAIQLVLNNLVPALRITGLLYAVPTLLAYVVAFTVPAPAEGQIPSAEYSMAMLVLQVVTVMWMAVAWHRYVLLDEMPDGLLPRFEGRRILSYFGLSLLLVLVGIPIALVGMLVLSALAPLGGFGVVIGMLAFLWLGLLIGYRLTLILPASAVDRPIRMRDAWQATTGHSGTIFVVAFLSAAGAIGLTLVQLPLMSVSVVLGLAWSIIVGWFISIVGVSILTSLYGVFIEKRAV